MYAKTKNFSVFQSNITHEKSNFANKIEKLMVKMCSPDVCMSEI